MEVTKNPTKVSVCVVTYNHEKYIRQCLQSIVDQVTDFDFEVIVGDDCSTDGTQEIIKEYVEKYPKIVKPIFHEKNIGAHKNYVFIHEKTVGEYTAHVDGDDYWFPNKLGAQVNFIENKKECAAVYTNATVIKKNNQVIGVFSSNVRSEFDTNYLIRSGNFLCNSSMLYRSALRVKLIANSDECIDYQIHIKLSENGFLGFIDEKLVAYRSDSSGSVIKNSNRHIRLLYLKALLGVDSSKVEVKTMEKALIDFLANAMFYELIYGNFSAYREWVICIENGATVNILKIQLFAFLLASKITAKKILNRLCRIGSRGDPNFIFNKK